MINLMSKFLIIIAALSFINQPVFAKEIQKNTFPQTKQPGTKELSSQEQEAIKQQQELDFLKKNNPEEYKKRKEFYDRQNKISSILAAFSDHKIDAIGARRQLYPLVKKDFEAYFLNLDSEISYLEKKIQSLKKIKLNNDMLIEKRIKQMLGEESPSPDDLY